MTSDIVALARHRLEQARDTEAEARRLLTEGFARGAVNRFYYAGFYAARACLAFREVDSSRHSGVIHLFQLHFVKAGLIDADVARSLPRAFEKRQKSDYGDYAVVTVEEAESIGGDIAVLIAACAALIDDLAAGA